MAKVLPKPIKSYVEPTNPPRSVERSTPKPSVSRSVFPQFSPTIANAIPFGSPVARRQWLFISVSSWSANCKQPVAGNRYLVSRTRLRWGQGAALAGKQFQQLRRKLRFWGRGGWESWPRGGRELSCFSTLVAIHDRTGKIAEPRRAVEQRAR